MKKNDRNAYDRIMKAAAKLFAKKGIEGTTTRQIVAEAGSSLSTLHAYFGSKEKLYQSVVDFTLDTFYAVNRSILKEIDEMKNQRMLHGSLAWDLIVQLTDQLTAWAFDQEYRNEILVIHREIFLPSGVVDASIHQSLYRIFFYYDKLFQVYTGSKDSSLKILAFSTVTTIFDSANYPGLLGGLLQEDLNLPDNQSRVKAHVKKYILTALRENLEMYLHPAT